MEGIKWEEICDKTHVLKVPGGFIIKYENSFMADNDEGISAGGITACMCFVPMLKPPSSHTAN